MKDGIHRRRAQLAKRYIKQHFKGHNSLTSYEDWADLLAFWIKNMGQLEPQLKYVEQRYPKLGVARTM